MLRPFKSEFSEFPFFPSSFSWNSSWHSPRCQRKDRKKSLSFAFLAENAIKVVEWTSILWSFAILTFYFHHFCFLLFLSFFLATCTHSRIKHQMVERILRFACQTLDVTEKRNEIKEEKLNLINVISFVIWNLNWSIEEEKASLKSEWKTTEKKKIKSNVLVIAFLLFFLYFGSILLFVRFSLCVVDFFKRKKRRKCKLFTTPLMHTSIYSWSNNNSSIYRWAKTPSKRWTRFLFSSCRTKLVRIFIFSRFFALACAVLFYCDENIKATQPYRRT